MPDGVGRANRVRARVALGDAEVGRGRRGRGDEAVVLVDAIGNRTEVVGGGSPRDTNDSRCGAVGRGEARREGGSGAVRRVEALEEQRVLDIRSTFRCARSSRRARRRARASRARRRRARRSAGRWRHRRRARRCSSAGRNRRRHRTYARARARRRPGETWEPRASQAWRKTTAIPGRAPDGLSPTPQTSKSGPLLLQRAVVVDEVGLLGLREPMLGEQQADRRERDVDLPVGGLRQRHVGDVELSERARAGERVEIEARGARRVL